MRRKPGQEKPRNRCRVPVQASPNISSGQGIAVMTNADGGRALIGEIKRAVAHEY
jgi:hypothetical protein